MKTLKPRLTKIFGPVLLLAACLAMSSCIIAVPRHPRHGRHDRHDRHERRWEAPRPFSSQEVRP
ncbi:MAG TPA: hypothetical protein VLB76_00555 [Thermoanaerobaculia bacterium]|jgi:hypothetical protein|nr:hypothetical protein [Thermoanaerobaculia bacterium]